MIPHPSTSRAPVGCSLLVSFSLDESKTSSHSPKAGRVMHEGRREMEKSIFFGERLGIRVPVYTCRRECRGILSSKRAEGPKELAVIARALERRQSSLDNWPDDRSPSVTRWEKVKSRYAPKEHWKPSKPTSDVDEQRIRTNTESHSNDPKLAEDQFRGESDADTGGYDELFRPIRRVLAKAKNQAIVATDYVKNLDATKLFSTTGENPLYPLPAFTGHALTVVGAVLIFGIILDALIWRVTNLTQRLFARNVDVRNDDNEGGDASLRSRAPSALSVLLERDLRRKESVEWVNMVIGKFWNLYRRGMETWLIDLLQPIIDDLEKPDYVRKVQVKSFFLGDDPLTVRTVERRTSRRADDLQYHIGVRYTGGARLLLAITLKLGIIPITIPVGVRGLDVDAEAWVKIRMLPAEPWIGQATWAFVTLPKIKLALAPFRLVNLMAIPFLSIFLAKLLTEDLPMLFVRPNKNVVDFAEGRAVGPVSKDFKDGIMMDGSTSFSGELSVTLVEARRLSYIPYLKTDPYCIFALGEQVRRSKRNSQTSIIGAPGAPVWNQDFKMLVVNQKTQHLSLTIHDTLGFTSYPVGSVDMDLRTLQDTCPVDRKLTLKSGWGPFPKRFAGELILRLTYKAYIDEDEEGETGGELIPKGSAVLDVPGAIEQVQEVGTFFREEAGKVAEFFQDKDLAKEMFSSLPTISSVKDVENVLPILGFEVENEKTQNEQSTGDSPAPSAVTSANGAATKGDQAAVNLGAKAKSSSQGNPVANPDREQVEKLKATSQQANGSSVQVEEPSTKQILFWLAVVTGIVWVVASDLNLSNLLNP